MLHPRCVLFQLFVVICFAVLPCANSPLVAQSVKARRGMVATVQPVATDAGIDAFKAGGNAIDAAVAAAVTLGVVDGHNSGLGGGCFVLIRSADGELTAIDGREMAPAGATRDMFVKDGEVVPGLSTTGPLAVGVPGALAAYSKAMSRFGKLKLRQLLRRAADVADEGFAVDRVYARNLKQSLPAIWNFPGSRKMLLKADGAAYLEGEVLKLPDLAESYRAMAANGTNWFYHGSFAEQVGDWMKVNGGLITKEDFGRYDAKDREPVITTYRDYKIVGFPPPSSGGIHVGQILNILEHFEMKDLLRNQPAVANHVIAEAMKLAFADRAHWLGDADFSKVPRGLVNPQYAKKLAQQITTTKVANVESHGLPDDWQSDVYGKHTTHVAAADAEGNWVAITATVNTSFGSKVVVPGTGVVLNNEMDDFSARPGVPNVFGLVGAEANAVAPGKRPLSSMSPTIVMKDGEPVLTVGGAGGPKIITQVLLAIVRFVDGQRSLDQCVSEPRLHHQWRPDRLFLEQSFDPQIVKKLEALGHEIEFLESAGISQAITRLPNGDFLGIADPRVPGKAAGY